MSHCLAGLGICYRFKDLPQPQAYVCLLSCTKEFEKLGGKLTPAIIEEYAKKVKSLTVFRHAYRGLFPLAAQELDDDELPMTVHTVRSIHLAYDYLVNDLLRPNEAKKRRLAEYEQQQAAEQKMAAENRQYQEGEQRMTASEAKGERAEEKLVEKILRHGDPFLLHWYLLFPGGAEMVYRVQQHTVLAFFFYHEMAQHWSRSITERLLEVVTVEPLKTYLTARLSFR